MQGRLEELRMVDPILTELARGYSNNALVAEELFPVVEVKFEAGKIPLFGKEAFKIYNTERGLRGDPNMAQPSKTTTLPFVLEEHELNVPADYREIAEDLFDLEQQSALQATSLVRLKLEYLRAQMAINPDNYPSGSKLALSGTAKFSSTDDPVVVIEAAKEAIRAKIGQRPNKMVIGPSTYNALKLHDKLLNKIMYSQKAVLTLELLQEIFGINRIVIGEAIYTNDAGSAFSDIWPDVCVLAFVPPSIGGQASMYQPNFAYTFRKAGSVKLEKWNRPDGKVRYFGYTTIEKGHIVGAESGYLLTDCV